VNALKAADGPLGVPGPLRRVTSPNARVVGLLRLDAGTPLAAEAAAITLVNPDLSRPDGIELGPLLTAAGGRIADFADATPGGSPLPFVAGTPLTLDPLGVRVFVGREARAARSETFAASAEAAEARLSALAADRVAIERVSPELDGGRFPVKRVVGDVLDRRGRHLRRRPRQAGRGRPLPGAGGRGVARGADALRRQRPLGRRLPAHRQHPLPLHGRGLARPVRLLAGRDHQEARRERADRARADRGPPLVERTAAGASGPDADALEALLGRLDERADDQGWQLAVMLGEDLRALMQRCDLRANRSRYGRELEVVVDRTAAAFAAWYEIFPRSMSDDPKPARHVRRRDREAALRAGHGLRRALLPADPPDRPQEPQGAQQQPHRPAGRSRLALRDRGRRGRPQGDPPGARRRGRLPPAGGGGARPRARDRARLRDPGRPDHPWITERPEWFDWRPDGTLKYAENPPKKYEDISHIEFYDGALPSVWYELRDTFLHWIDLGVKTFRVDNPHTKPYPFWEWCIREVQDRHPDTIFLAEAFTRPKVMSGWRRSATPSPTATSRGATRRPNSRST
jgi:starch synthase (maltosyl-transferring)